VTRQSLGWLLMSALAAGAAFLSYSAGVWLWWPAIWSCGYSFAAFIYTLGGDS
jgi:ABC-type multidrug transport system permease subunit